MEPSSIKVKVGVHEFEATGSEEKVNDQYQAFLKAIATVAMSLVNAAQAIPAQPARPAQPPDPAPLTDGLSSSMLDRMFRQDGDSLSLAALPVGDTAPQDAMLVLLYGFGKLKAQQSVTGTTLMKAAKKSGVVLERVDRVMDANMPAYVMAAGVKKARRYQLNNPGIARAEEIIRALMK